MIEGAVKVLEVQQTHLGGKKEGELRWNEIDVGVFGIREFEIGQERKIEDNQNERELSIYLYRKVGLVCVGEVGVFGQLIIGADSS